MTVAEASAKLLFSSALLTRNTVSVARRKKRKFFSALVSKIPDLFVFLILYISYVIF